MGQPVTDQTAISEELLSDQIPLDVSKPNFTALEFEEAQYFSVLDAIGRNTDDLIVIINAEGQVVYGNHAAQTLMGITTEQAKGTQARLYLHPDDIEEDLKFLAGVVATPGSSARREIRTLSPTGEAHQIEVVCTNMLDDPAIHAIVINGKDITQFKEHLLRLEALEERFRLAFEDNMAPMSFADVDDNILAANDAFCEMVGFSREELIGHDSTLFTYPEDIGITEETHQRVLMGHADHVRYNKRYQRKDGSIIDVEVSRAPAHDADGNILYFVFSERDITQEKKLTAQLSHQALYDSITGLANRTLMESQLLKARANVMRRGGMNALFLLDLDDFKGVNDTQGHLIGDQLLIGVARRFESVTRPADTLCRFGGDEFLYLAEDVASLDDVRHIARRLLEVLQEPFRFLDIAIDQRASIGVVVWGAEDSQDVDLLQNADVALYEAKKKGRGRFVMYEPSMHEEASHRFMLMQELRNSLSRGELELYFQPIVHLPGTEVIGFEGLMRWRHPERGWIAPAEFIPLAEGSDIILDIGVLAIESALAAASVWSNGCPREGVPFVTVNLSAKQFYSPSLVQQIESSLERHHVAPSRLILEITESVAISNFGETMNTIHRLERIGVGIALDDFGTGFSSLSYLAKISPRIIKVDQSFVQLANETPRDATLLEAIVTLGKNLQVTMLGEGVETSQQYARLASLGCAMAQGFLFSPAVKLGEASSLLGTNYTSSLVLVDDVS